MSHEQQSLDGEAGWGHLERHVLNPTFMALGQHVQAMRGDVLSQLGEKRRVRQMLAANPLGAEALLMTLGSQRLLKERGILYG